MENFRIVYYHLTDNYLDVDDTTLYWYEKLDGTDVDTYHDIWDDKKILKLIADYRKIIVKDFERYLKYVVKKLNNNEGLTLEMQNVIDTYNNGVDYTPNNDSSFITLTDDYLYFNNIENEIDELLLGSLDREEAFIYETVVIVKRDYKEFYFITKATNVLSVEEKYEVKAFSIVDSKVQEKVFKQKVDTYSEEYDREDIKRVLMKIKKLEDK